MMREEFEKMIGLEINHAEYTPIEAYYTSLPESVDKQKFAKMWLKEGGIQNLFNKRADNLAFANLRIIDLGRQIEELKASEQEWITRSNEQHTRIQELEKKLFAIKEMTA